MIVSDKADSDTFGHSPLVPPPVRRDRACDEVERVYRLGDALEKRRKLMEAWDAYITTEPAANVIQKPRSLG